MSTLKMARSAPVKSQAEDGKPPRPDPYQQVTDLIIEHLEKGVVPWRCPWNRETGRPRNFHSGHPYQGVNVVLLGCRFVASPWWMTYRQALERGGHVRKGERGAMVVKFGTFNLKESAPTSSEDGKQRKGMFLRSYTVFNATQIEGIQFPESATGPALSADQGNANAEAIVSAMPQCPVIHYGRGSRACYRPTLDEIEMPPFECFLDAPNYYATLAHELTHWTRHPSRLNRDFNRKRFGDEGYAKEELVAELGSCFLGADLAFEPVTKEDHAAYIQSWLKVLKNDKYFIIQAASHAQKAVEYVMNLQKKEPENKPTPPVLQP